MDLLSQYLEIATFIITIFGLPVAIYIYLQEQKLQREEREYGTYDALDDKYIELQQLCLDYPNLDVFDTPFNKKPDLTEGELKQEEAILLIRISIFERAYLMYQREVAKAKQNQWEGWDIEIQEWLERQNFKEIWDIHKQYYDRRFVTYFENKRS
ncbi:MAG: hypothetical protein DIZ80_17305 [endosymbiont of Galathealinum brachiosum]|uniref:DUF4760 domain-containing protein n=1 Tax=endosymbiont of Galathealinum brachiosum TaxID=2200906 RepID=A0A370D837_9GAMM|nr:MAG: hypothetical protein DIZ80_17305 [endosymbiont of Galathealinum brachiosum]